MKSMSDYSMFLWGTNLVIGIYSGEYLWNYVIHLNMTKHWQTSLELIAAAAQEALNTSSEPENSPMDIPFWTMLNLAQNESDYRIKVNTLNTVV